MKDSQQAAEPEHAGNKYIKANNERFSTNWDGKRTGK